MRHERRKLILSFVVTIVFGATSFPAIYTGLGIVLPASQSITLDSDRGRGKSASKNEVTERSEPERPSLSFRESLSVPKSRLDILHGSRSYQLSREPHSLLVEIAVGLSALFGISAGVVYRSRVRRKQPLAR